MATITHKITLSTTDHNLVGDIKVRQADDETIVLDAKILEHGLVKNFDGLKPFFCLMAREITGQGVSEEPVTVYDETKGTLKYTLSANAMQMVGRNEAYFSFRKELTNGSWAEQFSTRSFFYTVEKSIYTQPFKDSNYWFTFKELYRLFNDYIESGKLTWEDFMDTESDLWKNFINQNREIIESVDPGGQVLTELITARGGATTLGERLDSDKAEVTAQLAHIAVSIEDYSDLAKAGTPEEDWSIPFNEMITTTTNDISIIFKPHKEYIIRNSLIALDRTNVTIKGNKATIINKGFSDALVIDGSSFGSTRYNRVHDLYIKSENDVRADIYVHNSFRHFEITGCRLTGQARYGVLIDRCIKGEVVNNEISGNDRTAGVKLIGGGAESTTTITVDKNYIWSDAPAGGGEGHMDYGIHLEGTQANRVINNVIEGIGKYGVYVNHLGTGVNEPSIKNRIFYNYFEGMDISIYIENGGNNHHLLSNESINVNYGLYTNESKTRSIFDIPFKIWLGELSKLSNIIEPVIDGSPTNFLGTYIIDEGDNNQFMLSVNKDYQFRNTLSIHGDRRLKFIGDDGQVIGMINHTGGNMDVTTNGQFIVTSSGKPRFNDNRLWHTAPTVSRPTNPVAGYEMFDTSIGKPIWYTGDTWVDATGATV
ncbi:BppU family phage baseplate upper protein [Enterococcus gallinarum]|uniref:BppU family phage baseplate upper protein n=1 Tax=Enterococcus gallinarum TaxID=1353 RepID=UPI0035C9517A